MLGASAGRPKSCRGPPQTRGTPIEMPGAPDPRGIDAVGGTGVVPHLVFDVTSRRPSRFVNRGGPDRAAFTLALADLEADRRRPRLSYRVVTTAGGRASTN